MSPKNIDFEIVHCSSEEDEGSILELLNPGPSCRGWASAKYCIYPQEIVLKLEARSTIDSIQFLAHNHMIPKEIEIWLGDLPMASDDPELSKAMFYCLGEVEFSENSQTGWKGRQLQTVEMGNDDTRKNFVKGRFLKFILKQNHHIKLNEFNQVGLMGLAISGTPERPGGMNNKSGWTEDWSLLAKRQDLGFLMYTDRDVAILIHQLECRKYIAVDEERFDRARRLKDAISELLTMGPTLGALEVEKRRFVEKQDYEGAKLKKVEMEEMREACYRDLSISELLEFPSPSRRNSFVGRSSNYAVLPPPILHKSKPQQLIPEELDDDEEEEEVPVAASPIPPPQPVAKLNAIPSRESTRRYSKSSSSPPKPVVSKSSRKDTDDYDGIGNVQLSSNDKKDLQAAIEVFGESTIKRALHKAPNIKENACEHIKSLIVDYQPGIDPDMKPGRVVRGTTQILIRLIRDKVWAVFCQGISITNILYGHFVYANPVAKKELSDSGVKIFHELLKRTTDTNERVQEKAEDALHKMVSNAKILAQGTFQEALIAPLPPGTKEHPRIALTKAELILYFMAEMPDMVGQAPTTVLNLAKFAISAVDSSTPAVKKCGEKMMIRLYDLDPKAVRKVMPKDTASVRKSNRSYKILFEKFDELDAE